MVAAVRAASLMSATTDPAPVSSRARTSMLPPLGVSGETQGRTVRLTIPGPVLNAHTSTSVLRSRRPLLEVVALAGSVSGVVTDTTPFEATTR